MKLIPKSKIINILFLALLSVSLVIGITQQANAVSYTTKKNVTYNAQNQKLDYYKPTNANNRPIAIFIHGGGWVEGDKGLMSAHAAYLAANNITAISIDYRLAPQYPFPSAFLDVRDAVSWAKTNAKTLGGDPNKIVLVGYSAGANLAMLAGLHDTVSVRAIIGTAGPYNLETVADVGVRQAISMYMNGLHWGYGSPINLVSSNDPPVFMQHGSQDTLIDPLQSYFMAGALDSQKVSRILKIYDGAGHDMLYPTSPAYQTALKDILTYINIITL